MSENFEEQPELNYLHDLQVVARELDIGPEGVEILEKMDGPTRREFIKYATFAMAGVFALASSSRAERVAALKEWADQAVVKAAPVQEELLKINLRVNGTKRTVNLDPRTVLLDALRENMALTGTKKGCDHGQCGACTVLVDGRRVLSCLTLAAQVDGQSVTTIEGLAKGDELHPLQEAFIKHDAYQCGYCTPGQICSAVGMLEEAKRGTASHVTPDVRKLVTELSDDEVRERMSGNICRCGAYPKIVEAIHEVHSGKPARQTWAYHVEEGGRHDTV